MTEHKLLWALIIPLFISSCSNNDNSSYANETESKSYYIPRLFIYHKHIKATDLIKSEFNNSYYVISSGNTINRLLPEYYTKANTLAGSIWRSDGSSTPELEEAHIGDLRDLLSKPISMIEIDGFIFVCNSYKNTLDKDAYNILKYKILANGELDYIARYNAPAGSQCYKMLDFDGDILFTSPAPSGTEDTAKKASPAIYKLNLSSERSEPTVWAKYSDIISDEGGPNDEAITGIARATKYARDIYVGYSSNGSSTQNCLYKLILKPDNTLKSSTKITISYTKTSKPQEYIRDLKLLIKEDAFKILMLTADKSYSNQEGSSNANTKCMLYTLMSDDMSVSAYIPQKIYETPSLGSNDKNLCYSVRSYMKYYYLLFNHKDNNTRTTIVRHGISI